MKFLLLALVVLIVTVALALVAQQDPGYVLLTRGDWSLETSLSLLAVVLVGGFFLLYALFRLLGGTWRFPGRWQSWRRERRAARAREASQRGLVELAEGRWEKAERDLIKSAPYSDTPLLNYLGAARAAQKQDAGQRRDRYLSLAHQATPDAELAIGLTQAEVQISNDQLEEALATLMHLRSVAPRHAQVLHLLKRLYQQLQSWGDMADLLPELRRGRVLEEPELNALERRTYRHLLEIAARSQHAERLKEAWQRLPKSWVQDPSMLAFYAEQLAALGHGAEAERVLRESLKRSWEPTLVQLYGLVDGEDPQRQLLQAESWLKKHEKQPRLLLTLGRLALKNSLWGKARAYLEASLGQQPLPETYRELGALLEQLQEEALAREYYRKGLEQAVGPQACTRFTVHGLATASTA